MIISKNKKFIFIHTIKTVGNSIRSELGKHCYDRPFFLNRLIYIPFLFLRLNSFFFKIFDKINFPFQMKGHIKAKEIKEKLGIEFYNYFSFGIVRNPWDWQVSLYFYMKQNKKHFQHYIIKNVTYKEYIYWRLKKENLALQKDYFYDNRENLIVSKVYKFENLDYMISNLNKKFNINIELIHKKKLYHKNYKDCYDFETWNLIKDYYKDDILLFGYTDNLD